jgi:predicted nucleic acid-binding protein
VSFLLDTSFISELVKKEPNLPALAWLDGQDEDALYLSVVTIGELEKGIARLATSARKNRLQTWVRRDLATRFAGRLLSIDLRVAARWGTLTGMRRSAGGLFP